MFSTDVRTACQSISFQHREMLWDVAESSIQAGLFSGAPLVLEPTLFPAALRDPRACFITLRLCEQLRGCIGSVKASRPLVVDVAENAFNAAFRDPRFPPLGLGEFPALTIHISVLSPLEPLTFSSETDLLERIRPGTDGLEIEYGPYRGLLLPSVWDQVPDERQFWQALKLKAGLPATFWSPRIKVYRFTTESFGRQVKSSPDNAAT